MCPQILTKKLSRDMLIKRRLNSAIGDQTYMLPITQRYETDK